MAIEKLTDFAYIEEDRSLHFDIPKMLEALGVPDTEENRDACAKMCVETSADILKGIVRDITVTEEPSKLENEKM